MRWSWSSPRMVTSWLDRDPWVPVGFALPLTIVVLGALAGHPFLFVFVPLLVLAVLAGVVFVVMDFYKGQKREPEQQAQVGAGPQKRNRQSHADQARAQAERNLSRLELEAEVRARTEAAEAEALTAEARVRAEAAEAEALAAEARARAIRLRA